MPQINNVVKVCLLLTVTTGIWDALCTFTKIEYSSLQFLVQLMLNKRWGSFNYNRRFLLFIEGKRERTHTVSVASLSQWLLLYSIYSSIHSTGTYSQILIFNIKLFLLSPQVKKKKPSTWGDGGGREGNYWGESFFFCQRKGKKTIGATINKDKLSPTLLPRIL